MRKQIIVLAAALLIAVGLGGYAWWDTWQGQRSADASREALAVAPAAAAAIFSYDYRTFDAAVANGRNFATGTFASEYAKTTTALKDSVVKEQAVVTAQVSASGVIEASPEQVQVLLFVNQYRRNVNISGEKVDQNRVVLTLVKVDDAWKVSAASAL
jgi:Mce-associated membrane protein